MYIHCIVSSKNISDHLKPNTMFVIQFNAPVYIPEEEIYPYGEIKKQTFMLENLNPQHLKYIFENFPFVVNNKKYNFKRFVTIRETEKGIELSFWYNITRQQKSLLFKMIDGVINTYQLSLLGIRIRYKVHPKLQEEFGEMRKEKIMFKESACLWNFSPENKEFGIVLSNKTRQTIEWIMKNEYFYSEEEFINTTFDTKLITSLIIG